MLVEQNLFLNERKKKRCKQLSFALGGIALFYAVVCTPVYLILVSDVLYADTVLPFLWDILMKVCNYLFYWLSFAYLFYSVLLCGVKNSMGVVIVYAVVVPIRYFANHFASYVINGSQSTDEFLSDYLPYILLDTVLDGVQFALALGMIAWLLQKYLSPMATEKQRSTFLSSNMPLEARFKGADPIAKIACWIAAIPAFFQFVSRLIYDFSMGLPSNLFGILWMLGAYLSDIAFAVIGYLLLALLLNRLYLADLKAQCEFEES